MRANDKPRCLSRLPDRVFFAAGPQEPNLPSSYARHFNQGATILPRNFYFVRVPDLDGSADPDRVYWAETEPRQAREAKAPYKGIHIEGQVEGRFIFSTAISRHLLPFALLEPAVIVLPVLADRTGALELCTADDLRRQGYREFAGWMEKVEHIWNTKRKKKAARQTAYERLDYQGELTRQNTHSQHLVLYNAAGTNVAAAHVDTEALCHSFVVEHKLYLCVCKSAAEADYLAAFLNANEVNERIKPFQTQGLLGERDIERKVLELPIPLFDPDNSDHNSLAQLGAQAASDAKTYLEGANPGRSLGRQRTQVRRALASTLRDIDRLVRHLL